MQHCIFGLGWGGMRPRVNSLPFPLGLMTEIFRRSKSWCSQTLWSTNGSSPHWAASQCSRSRWPLTALATSPSQGNLEKWVPAVDGGNVRDRVPWLSAQVLGVCHCLHLSLLLDPTWINPTAAAIGFPVPLCRRAMEVEQNSQPQGAEPGGPTLAFWLLQVGQVITRTWHLSPGATMAHAGHGASPYLGALFFSLERASSPKGLCSGVFGATKVPLWRLEVLLPLSAASMFQFWVIPLPVYFWYLFIYHRGVGPEQAGCAELLRWPGGRCQLSQSPTVLGVFPPRAEGERGQVPESNATAISHQKCAWL